MCTSSASTRSFSEKKDNDPTEEHNIRACVKNKKKKKNISNEFHEFPQLNESALFNRQEHRI